MWRARALPFLAALMTVVCTQVSPASAAGVLKPVSAAAKPIEVQEHRVRVVVNNGFSRTEVSQTFFNPNSSALDATYEFPVPPDAALSEMTIEVGDRTLTGEVVEKERASDIYEREKAAGEQAGLAVQNGYQNFVFSVAQVPANGTARMTFVYYEPVAIDAGIGRFLYPLEFGGTDDGAAFWTGEVTSTGHFSFDLELKSAAKVSDVRVPSAPGAQIDELEPGHYQVHLEAAPGTLNEDVVVYYKLEDEAPCDVQLVAYRPESGGQGTFLLLATPGLDLPALERGTDYSYVLDFSGSMQTKLATLKAALADVLAELLPEDRFRIVIFSDTAYALGGYASATPANVQAALAELSPLGTLGGTNLYAGLEQGFLDNDPERVTSVFLITDGVANQGVIAPLQFDAMLRERDVRVFGFLMGNSANWPLMQVITEASGGFYAAVSNRDDVIGQALLAKNKLTHESMHDARLRIEGAAVSDTTDFDLGKVYRGQQLAIFGRYRAGAEATLNLTTRIRGQNQSYSQNLHFPEVAAEHPELERLWALEMIHATQKHALLGLMPEAEARARVRELGIDYQLVTDETSMIVLDDAGFEEYGVDRKNRDRTSLEQAPPAATPGGSAAPGAAPVSPVGTPPGTSPGRGDDYVGDDRAGALDPLDAALLLALGLSLIGPFGARRRRGSA